MDKRLENLTQKFIEAWKKTLKPDRKWVLFSNGTCVVDEGQFENIEQDSIEFLKQNGKIVPGTPLGDFNVQELAEGNIWIVFSYLDAIMTIVLREEIEEEDIGDLEVGLFGRYKRDKDAQELQIIHISTS
ncbi:MAG: hypothetical protein FK734_03000 [Asgard group archaeon]|nr:hypothetical protein [Asgard group archaeon]